MGKKLKIDKRIAIKATIITLLVLFGIAFIIWLIDTHYVVIKWLIITLVVGLFSLFIWTTAYSAIENKD